MIFKVLDFKEGVQSLRLQRLSVKHSIRKNVQDFAKLLIFFEKVNNKTLKIFWIPTCNSIIHRCIIHNKLDEIFMKKKYYFYPKLNQSNKIIFFR